MTEKTPALRPKDAATLVLYRRHGSKTEVLMGARAAGMAFHPNMYVFPGGRVERQDARAPAAREPAPGVIAALMRGGLTRARARAFVMTAIRETFEETGLHIARPAVVPPSGVPAGWGPFVATGLLPAADNIRLIARAITGPNRPRRFDARFFMLDAEHCQGEMGGDGELQTLTWLDIKAAHELPIPDITRIIIDLVDNLLSAPLPQPDAPVFFSRTVRGKRIITRQ